MALRPLTDQEKMDIEFGRMLRKVSSDPKTRRDVYQTLKKADPSVVWPDQQMEDFRQEQRAEREREKIAQETERKKQEMIAQRARIVERYGEDNIKAIEAVMQKHGIWDYEAGAKLWNADQPPPSQGAMEGPGSDRWSLPTDKELLDNPTKWANDMARATIREMRSQHGIRAGSR